MANFTVSTKTLGRRSGRFKAYSRTGGVSRQARGRRILTTARVIASAARTLFSHKRSAHEQPAHAPSNRDDRAARIVCNSLSDDGPFHPLADKEARRAVVFAYVFYAVLAATILAVLIWR